MDGFMTLGIVLLVLGFVLIGIELVVPGFGFSGISGIVCLAGGVLLTAENVEQGLTITMIVIVILTVMLTIAMAVFKRIKAPVILESEMKAKEGYLTASDLEYLIGKEGIASTDLRPAGKCSIDGVEFDVRSEIKYTECGTKVYVSRIHENTIMVRER